MRSRRMPSSSALCEEPCEEQRVRAPLTTAPTPLVTSFTQLRRVLLLTCRCHAVRLLIILRAMRRIPVLFSLTLMATGCGGSSHEAESADEAAEQPAAADSDEAGQPAAEEPAEEAAPAEAAPAPAPAAERPDNPEGGMLPPPN
jgi:hypothetical protein